MQIGYRLEITSFHADGTPDSLQPSVDSIRRKTIKEVLEVFSRGEDFNKRLDLGGLVASSNKFSVYESKSGYLVGIVRNTNKGGRGSKSADSRRNSPRIAIAPSIVDKLDVMATKQGRSRADVLEDLIITAYCSAILNS